MIMAIQFFYWREKLFWQLGVCLEILVGIEWVLDVLGELGGTWNGISSRGEGKIECGRE